MAQGVKADPDRVELRKLFELAPTRQEIAAWFEVSRQTVQVWARQDWFKALEEAALDKRNISLKRAQWKSALGGSVPMQIWLGKQYLGQRDQPETQLTADDIGKAVADHIKHLEGLRYGRPVNGAVDTA